MGGAVHRGQNVCKHVVFLMWFRVHATPGCALRVLVVGGWLRDIYFWQNTTEAAHDLPAGVGRLTGAGSSKSQQKIEGQENNYKPRFLKPGP